MQLSAFKMRPIRISHIFISHLHGDHYFGLIGLLTSMGLNQRTTELHVFAPPALREIIQLQLQAAFTELPYPVVFVELNGSTRLFEDNQATVDSFPVKHRIACWGFIFREKKNPRKIDPVRASAANIPMNYYSKLQAGGDYIAPGGGLIENDRLTTEGEIGKSYAFCADTIYYPEIVDSIKEVDLLYHEATFLHVEQEKASARFHTTALEAGMVAKAAGVKKLLIGHFSAKYNDLEPLACEAKTNFENTECAIEGACYLV